MSPDAGGGSSRGMSNASRLTAAAVALTLFVGAPATAWAADWATSFPPSAVAEHADARGEEVAVLAVGARAKAAAAALGDAMRRADEVAAVRDAKSLGALEGLDDPTILGRARVLGADRYVLVRVFEGDDPEAVVSIYDAAGEAIGGFSARPGQPVDGPLARAGGRDTDVSEAIATVAEDSEQTLDEFERRQVVFDQSLLIVSDGSSATVSRRFHPRTGAGQALAGAEFYRYVGEDDLAKKYQRRRATRIGLGVGAGATMVAGLGVMLGYGLGKSLSATSRMCDAEIGSLEYEACEADKSADRKRALKIGMGAGSGLLVGGLVLAVVAVRIDPHPVSGADAVGLAQTFNDRLRDELGLPKRRRASAQTTANVSAGPEGAGLVLSGRF